MYFIRLKPLKEELASRVLPEKDRYRYLIWWMALITLMSWSGIQTAQVLKPFLMIANPIITILGVRYAWRRNGGEQGTAIFDRYFSIAWVMNIRVMIALFIIQAILTLTPGIRDAVAYVDSAVAAVAFQFSDEEYSEELGMLTATLVLLGEAYLAVAIGRHVGDVRRMAETAGYPGSRQEAGRQQLDRFVESVTQREITVDAPPAVPRRRRRPSKAAKRIRTRG